MGLKESYMYYYKHINNGIVTCLESRSIAITNTSDDIISIEKSEYDSLLLEMFPLPDPNEISDSEALNIILGG